MSSCFLSLSSHVLRRNRWISLVHSDSKRTVPIRSPETIRKKFMEPSASWRIDRLTSYLTDLVRRPLNTKIFSFSTNFSSLDRRWTKDTECFVRYWSIINSIKHRWWTVSTEHRRFNRGSLFFSHRSSRTLIFSLFQENLQRHRSFSEQLTQISSLLVQLMNHGNTLKEISSSNKTTPLSNSTRRTKER